MESDLTRCLVKGNVGDLGDDCAVVEATGEAPAASGRRSLSPPSSLCCKAACTRLSAATEAAVRVLENGGNAIDAAVAVNAMLGLVEPHMNGIGGDMFAIVWDAKSGELYGLNGSGRAPMSLSADKVPANDDGTIPLYSPYSWTVPGTVDGWFELHDKFGKLPMTEILAPAIRYAREGAPISEVIAFTWAAPPTRCAWLCRPG